MAKDKDEIKDDQSGDEQGKLPSGKKPLIIKILLIAIGVVIIIGDAIITSYMVSTKAPEPKFKDGENPEQAIGAMVDKVSYGQWILSKGKEPMKFNLQKKDNSSSSSPILLADIVLAWNMADIGMFKKKDPTPELELRREQIKDIVVKFFNTKTVEEVSLAHEADLKGELQKYINGILPDNVARITNIFFPQYFVQQ